MSLVPVGKGSFPVLESSGLGQGKLERLREGTRGWRNCRSLGLHPCLTKHSGHSCFLFSGGNCGAIEVSMTQTTAKNPWRWEFVSQPGCRGPEASILWDRAVLTPVQMQAPTWLPERNGTWIRELEDLHRSALCGWRKEEGRECERIIGRGRKRGKSLPILSCSYRTSLPRGLLHPPVMTKVKGQRETFRCPICAWKWHGGKRNRMKKGPKSWNFLLIDKAKELSNSPTPILMPLRPVEFPGHGSRERHVTEIMFN